MVYIYIDFATQNEGDWIRDRLQLGRVWDLGTGTTGVGGDFDIRTDEEAEMFKQDVETANRLLRDLADEYPDRDAAKFVEHLDHINEALPALVRKTGTVYRSTSTDKLLTLAHGGAAGVGAEKRDRNYGQEDNISTSASFEAVWAFNFGQSNKLILEMDVSELDEGKEWLAQEYGHRPTVYRIKNGKPAGLIMEKFGDMQSAASAHLAEVRLKYGAKPKIKAVYIPANMSPKVVNALKRQLKPLGIKIILEDDKA